MRYSVDHSNLQNAFPDSLCELPDAFGPAGVPIILHHGGFSARVASLVDTPHARAESIAREIVRVALPRIFHGNGGEELQDGEEAAEDEHGDRPEVGWSRRLLRTTGRGPHLPRSGVDECDALVLLGQVEEGQSVHGGGLVDEVECSPALREAEVILAKLRFFPAAEHAEHSRLRRLVEQREEVADEPQPCIVGEDEADF